MIIRERSARLLLCSHARQEFTRSTLAAEQGKLCNMIVARAKARMGGGDCLATNCHHAMQDSFSSPLRRARRKGLTTTMVDKECVPFTWEGTRAKRDSSLRVASVQPW